MVKIDKVYTRGGDKGKTSLADGSRVSKTDKIIIALLQIIFYLFLVFIGLFLGFGYCFYFFLVLATAVGVYNQKLIMNRKPDLCIKAFKNNQYIGFLIFLGIYGEYII